MGCGREMDKTSRNVGSKREFGRKYIHGIDRRHAGYGRRVAEDVKGTKTGKI